MIYFIDEDVGQMWDFRAELIARGHEVVHLSSADAAFAALASVPEVELAIIDVMLAVDDYKSERFSRERTSDYLETGLVLLDELCDQNPPVFPRRAVLLTSTVRREVLLRAQRMADEHDIALLRKQHFTTSWDFGNAIASVLERIDGGDYGLGPRRKP
jgi:hypothetical protein